MKKIVAMMLVVMMVFAVAATASASVNFEFWAQCKDESSTNLQHDESAYETKYKDDDKVYVKHWVYGGSNDYTNFFRALRDDGAMQGQKWIATNQNIPIQSTAISKGMYTAAGRGNSKHYNNDGNYRVSLHGPFDADILPVD